MNLSFLKRDIPKRLLAGVLVLAAVAGVVAGREKPSTDLLEARAPAARAVQAPEPDIDLAKLRREAGSAPQGDPFARRSLAPAQTAAAPDAPAGPPQAPPLPFTYFGKLIEDGKTEVFLMRGDEVIAIRAGQRIDRDYMVDKITDSSIRFTYLPLGRRQSMSLEAEG